MDGRRGLLAVVIACAALAPSCARPRPTPPPAAQLEPGDLPKLRAAVDEAQAALGRAGLPFRLVIAPPSPDDAGALLPLQHHQLPQDRPLVAVLTPLRDRIRPRAETCAPGGVCVLLVPEIAPPSGAAAALLPELEGLALGPQVFGEGRGVLPAVAAAAGWQGGVGPNVVVLSARHLRRRGPAARAALVLHEVGHLLGLPHTAAAGGVMTPGEPGRIPAFSQREVAQALPVAVSWRSADRGPPQP